MVKKGTFKNRSLNLEEENGWEYLRASKKLQRHGISFKDHEAGQSIIYLMIQEILEMDDINEEDRVFYVRKQVLGILVNRGNILSYT